jgi:hypothetical protein
VAIHIVAVGVLEDLVAVVVQVVVLVALVGEVLAVVVLVVSGSFESLSYLLW